MFFLSVAVKISQRLHQQEISLCFWDIPSYWSQSAGTVEYANCVCRGIRPHVNKCRRYTTKPSNVMGPILELWGMWSISSLPLIPGLLWSLVEVAVRVSSLGQTKLFHHLLRNIFIGFWNHTTVCKLPFNSYSTTVYGRALLHSLVCPTLLLIHIL